MRQLRDGDTLAIDSDLLKLNRFTVGDIEFDNVNGAGSVPMMANLHYMGVMVAMTPRIFLSITPRLDAGSRPDTIPFLETNKGPLGSPFLINRTQEIEGLPVVSSHEGRHRMWWIAKHYGDDFEIPVGLFIRENNYSFRGREIEPEIIKQIAGGCYREKAGSFVEGPLFTKACWANGSFDLSSSNGKNLTLSI